MVCQDTIEDPVLQGDGMCVSGNSSSCNGSTDILPHPDKLAFRPTRASGPQMIIALSMKSTGGIHCSVATTRLMHRCDPEMNTMVSMNGESYQFHTRGQWCSRHLMSVRRRSIPRLMIYDLNARVTSPSQQTAYDDARQYPRERNEAQSYAQPRASMLRET